MREKFRNRSDPAKMVYAIKWTGCGDTGFAQTSNDTGGLTWELQESFTKATGSLRDSRDVLKKWLDEYKKTAAGGPRGGHQHYNSAHKKTRATRRQPAARKDGPKKGSRTNRGRPNGRGDRQKKGTGGEVRGKKGL